VGKLSRDLADRSDLEGTEVDLARQLTGLGESLRAAGQFDRSHLALEEAISRYQSLLDEDPENDTLKIGLEKARSALAG
jgi:hypothetical protein